MSYKLFDPRIEKQELIPKVSRLFELDLLWEVSQR